MKQAQDAYASASKSGGSSYASVTSYLAASTDAVKDSTFDTWSDSELKSYLDSYGLPAYQGSTTNELKAAARRNAQYFRYGTNTPGASIWDRVTGSVNWLLSQAKLGAASGRQSAEVGGDYAKEGYTQGKDRAYEAGQKVGDKAKEEL